MENLSGWDLIRSLSLLQGIIGIDSYLLLTICGPAPVPSKILILKDHFLVLRA